jgi:hypothetical protein
MNTAGCERRYLQRYVVPARAAPTINKLGIFGIAKKILVTQSRQQIASYLGKKIADGFREMDGPVPGLSFAVVGDG